MSKPCFCKTKEEYYVKRLASRLVNGHEFLIIGTRSFVKTHRSSCENVPKRKERK